MSLVICLCNLMIFYIYMITMVVNWKWVEMTNGLTLLVVLNLLEKLVLMMHMVLLLNFLLQKKERKWVRLRRVHCGWIPKRLLLMSFINIGEILLMMMLKKLWNFWHLLMLMKLKKWLNIKMNEWMRLRK